MTDCPTRIRLSRARGWRMPENTVKVDRTTSLGNPFVTGKHGTRLECLGLFILAVDGKFCLTCNVPIVDQERLSRAVRARAAALRCKNLACWCNLPAPGEPDLCHARVLLDFINQVPRAGSDTDRIMRTLYDGTQRARIYIDANDLKAAKARQSKDA